jgi:hypothetical protein
LDKLIKELESFTHTDYPVSENLYGIYIRNYQIDLEVSNIPNEYGLTEDAWHPTTTLKNLIPILKKPKFDLETGQCESSLGNSPLRIQRFFNTEINCCDEFKGGPEIFHPDQDR